MKCEFCSPFFAQDMGNITMYIIKKIKYGMTRNLGKYSYTTNLAN